MKCFFNFLGGVGTVGTFLGFGFYFFCGFCWGRFRGLRFGFLFGCFVCVCFLCFGIYLFWGFVWVFYCMSLLVRFGFSGLGFLLYGLFVGLLECVGFSTFCGLEVKR